ncbi:methylmalonyl-CoA epimerase (plasmid) [Rhizobium leguminosarum bv. trifolii WSM2304]|uniref:Methylmalonyl-CoA epimerase n=1 Tax=Rhizobium leguminosarum bv. trifolii (strain WSM2304) TaxID=395492 RepID=A0ABF7QYY1_RHILW|nr:methylmalonyl-CoA epimerase [Rhizobium leguminosarum]ACI59518.1 methylmalonyl-CoA epimerase [Rhizobium leguminosarum bv. trifolii WSM2304]
MLKRVNHIAIAVPDLGEASEVYRALGVPISEPQVLPEHGVRVCFLEFANVKLELLEAIGDGSPIAKFLGRNPAGGVHHICYDVDDLVHVAATVKNAGVRLLGNEQPKIGAHGHPVLFAHPSDLSGVLTELRA